MIISTYYNKQNKVLINTSQAIVDSKEKINNIEYFYDKKKQLVGLNIFEIDNYTSGVVNIKKEEQNFCTLFNNYQFGFIYGKIVSIQNHEKSEKLKICQVDIGNEIIQIVCGASNCVEGKIAVVAIVGAVMPNTMQIKQSKVMGVESNGMLCSASELGISEEKSGILLFDEIQYKIGSDFRR